jgi:hypothetical protein
MATLAYSGCASARETNDYSMCKGKRHYLVCLLQERGEVTGHEAPDVYASVGLLVLLDANPACKIGAHLAQSTQPLADMLAQEQQACSLQQTKYLEGNDLGHGTTVPPQSWNLRITLAL